MKRVLIIGSDFVPSSLPPATRIRFFARHLPEFGWKPIILTTDPEHYESPTDPDSENLLPPYLEVIRTRAFSAKWTRKFGVGDIGIRSLWYHWQALNHICKERKIDLIFIPVPPYVPMVLARLAYQRFRIPYVVDYIDPWVTEYYWKLPKRQRPPKWAFSYALSRVLEPFALKRVSHITGVSKGTTESVTARYSWLSAGEATEIPYGGELDDFEYIRQHPRQNQIFDRRDGLLHLSYVGACIPSMYATVRALFQAMRLGLTETPELFSRVRLHFVGTSYSPNGPSQHGVLALAREADVDAYVDEHPERIAYLESLQVMLDSHALFLLGSEEPHYTASKVFPYILAHRPLLAVFHEASNVVAILRDTGVADAITFNFKSSPATRVEEILEALERILFLPAASQVQTRRVGFEPYTTRAMAGRLASCFDQSTHHRTLRISEGIRSVQTQ